MKTTYIVAVAVDEDELKKTYKKIGAPDLDDVEAMVRNEINMSGKLEIIRIDKINVEL